MVQATGMLASPATDTAVAVGTSAAAVVALATLAFLCYQWAKDRRERRTLEEQKQATRINCWFTQTSTEFLDKTDNPEFRVTGKLEWLNRSDDPVYSIIILGHLATMEVDGFPLSKKRRPIGSSDHIPMPVMTPGSSGAKEYTWKFDADRASALFMEFVLGWQFNDARGVTWLKTSRGHMRMVKHSSEARDAMAADLLSTIRDWEITADALANAVRAKRDEALKLADEIQIKLDEDSEKINEIEAKLDEAEKLAKENSVQREADTGDNAQS